MHSGKGEVSSCVVVSRGEPPEVVVRQIETLLVASPDLVLKLVQCAVLMKWESIWALDQVTEAEVEVRQLEGKLVVVTVQVNEV